MGLLDVVKDQFLDVIEYEDVSNKLIVYKYQRESGNNELKQGSKVIVRESQSAVFLKGGQLADILLPGTYSLNTDNMPVLSTLKAFPYLFVSPVIADLYFVSTRQFIDNKWATKNPIMKRDSEFNMARIRAFGKFSFRITDVALFMREIFGTKGIVLTYDIVSYLSSMVTVKDKIAKTFATISDNLNVDIDASLKVLKCILNELQEREKFCVCFGEKFETSYKEVYFGTYKNIKENAKQFKDGKRCSNRNELNCIVLQFGLGGSSLDHRRREEIPAIFNPQRTSPHTPRSSDPETAESPAAHT